MSVAILGLVQVPELRKRDKIRVASLTNILGAVLTRGAQHYAQKYQDGNGIPFFLYDFEYALQGQHLPHSVYKTMLY